MTPDIVRAQLDEVYSRLIRSGLSVKQNRPSISSIQGGGTRIGHLPNTAFALKNVSYGLIYSEIDSNNSYHIKMPDGGLLLFQYTFSSANVLTKHRLAFFPCNILPTVEEAPHLYENDELYGDIIVDRLVRFPIRLDYDPENHQDVFHPISHLTLGQFEYCRIPLVGPVLPNVFILFIIRNFYHRYYQRFKNTFEKNLKNCRPMVTITAAERRISHFLMA